MITIDQRLVRSSFKQGFLSLLLLFTSLVAYSQPNVQAFAQMDSLQVAEPRPMVVFLHADWCRYCQHMQQTSLRDPEVVELLNEKFYFLSLDAESEEPITFSGHEFAFQASGNGTGTHALASALGSVDGKLQYPSLVIMNTQYEIIFQYGAFLEAKALLEILAAGVPNK